MEIIHNYIILVTRSPGPFSSTSEMHPSFLSWNNQRSELVGLVITLLTPIRSLLNLCLPKGHKKGWKHFKDIRGNKEGSMHFWNIQTGSPVSLITYHNAEHIWLQHSVTDRRIIPYVNECFQTHNDQLCWSTVQTREVTTTPALHSYRLICYYVGPNIHTSSTCIFVKQLFVHTVCIIFYAKLVQ